ncbi:MAG TPA: hypothetical protein VGO47_04475 [Chlamydiales bacterium]|nr:hypothetical protein [Chlamydiales bacterium]
MKQRRRLGNGDSNSSGYIWWIYVCDNIQSAAKETTTGTKRWLPIQILFMYITADPTLISIEPSQRFGVATPIGENLSSLIELNKKITSPSKNKMESFFTEFMLLP